jgi:hypothetical protein
VQHTLVQGCRSSIHLFTSGPVLHAVYAAHADLQHQLHVARTRSGHAACRRTRSSRVFESIWLWGRGGLRGSAAVHHKRVYALCPSQENICLVSITAEYMPCVLHSRIYALCPSHQNICFHVAGTRTCTRARAYTHVHTRMCAQRAARPVRGRGMEACAGWGPVRDGGV